MSESAAPLRRLARLLWRAARAIVFAIGLVTILLAGAGLSGASPPRGPPNGAAGTFHPLAQSSDGAAGRRRAVGAAEAGDGRDADA